MITVHVFSKLAVKCAETFISQVSLQLSDFWGSLLHYQHFTDHDQWGSHSGDPEFLGGQIISEGLQADMWFKVGDNFAFFQVFVKFLFVN